MKKLLLKLALAELEAVRCRLAILDRKADTLMATLEEVLTLVRAQTTALDSVKELIQGLRQQVADALSNMNLNPAEQAKVDEIFTAAEVNRQKIAEALAANVTE